MGKAPATQFYWNEWARDLEEHPLEIEGAWMRICGKLWYSKEVRGKLTLRLSQWANVLRVDNSNTYRILSYLCTENVGDFPCSVTDDPDGKVTVICRRMYREETAKINNALRQQRYKQRRKGNAVDNSNGNGKVTPPSSSSPSSSEEDKEPEEPLSRPDQNSIVKEISSTVDKLKPLYPRFNAFSFIGANRKAHPEAMLHVLKSLIRASEAGTEVGEPFAYARAALKIEEGKYNSRDHERRSQDFKKPGVMSLSEILAQAQRGTQ